YCRLIFALSAVKIRDSLFVFCKFSSLVRKEVVSAFARFRRCRTLLPVLLLLLPVLYPCKSSGEQAASKTRPAAKNPTVPAAPASVGDDLVRRIEAQRAAVRSGDPAAIEQTSQKVTAVALREMAGLRALAGDWPQAIQLYRQSLDLEDVANVRVDLAVAYISDN